MNENLKKAIMLYATESTEKLFEYLNGLSKPSLIGTFIDFLTVYLNDKNSSKLRELITLWIAGCKPNLEKLGYNGYKMDIESGKRIECEVKPQNVDKKNKKLNGGGSFNDYTPERFQKDLEKNPTILVSGFVKGKLIFVFAFPFRCLREKLSSILNKKFGENRRKKGEYVRSASFSFKDYKNCPDLKIVYIRKDWQKFRNFLTKDIIKFLETYGGF